MREWVRVYFDSISRALKKANERQGERDGDIEAAIEWAEDGARFAREEEGQKDERNDWWNEIQGG